MPYDPLRHGPKRIVGPGFHEQVYAIVKQVPKGFVTTYGDVGRQLGSSRVARHVGFALAGLSGKKGKGVPWHRVVNSQGRLSFSLEEPRGVEQAARLKRERVIVRENGRIESFGKHRFEFED